VKHFIRIAGAKPQRKGGKRLLLGSRIGISEQGGGVHQKKERRGAKEELRKANPTACE